MASGMLARDSGGGYDETHRRGASDEANRGSYSERVTVRAQGKPDTRSMVQEGRGEAILGESGLGVAPITV
eukprot:scaffold5372_cov114-Isochrysis_galbana.AAC.6